MSAPGKLAITIRNRQRVRCVNTRRLKKIIAAVLAELRVTDCELCFHLVAEKEMASINWQFLQHEGSTDVITFDNNEHGTWNSELGTAIAGEIFICLDDAVKQAKEFGTSWQSELARYAIHGILHLLGHDDLKPAARKKMKREENRLVKCFGMQFTN